LTTKKIYGSVIQKELTRQGHEAETAPDGQAAWELMEARDFDVLPLRHKYAAPRRNGFASSSEREDALIRRKVIMLTGQGTG
jgi:DNA-binding response OmpR family regulator